MGLSGLRLCVDSNSLTPLGPIPKQNHTVLFYSNNFTQFCKWLEQWGLLRSWDHVPFADELRQLLPADLPFREVCIAGAARHLDLIVEANRHFNLTRIVDPREAAIKHVFDSVLPWRLFLGADHVADAGSGAGFPGIPLALALPQTRFTLLDSTQKKARFLESVVRELKLPNVEVRAERAEEWLNTHRVAIVTARAVAPLNRAASDR